MNREFWDQKKILITGHTGFKGSWLSLWLQNFGADVVGYSLPPPTTPSLYDLADIEQGMKSVQGDVRDFGYLTQVIAEHQPQIVIHMAAQSLVRQSYQDPIETYETNVMGTVNVLEAVRQVGTTKAVVVVTSDKCYENREWVWGYRENEAMGGYDPYSSSKGCAELVTAAFRRSFFNATKTAARPAAIASVRAGNVVGGGDWASDRLVPDIMRALLADRPAVIRNPEATRPWQHVLDPLAGYIRLMENLVTDGSKYAESWNFGPRVEDAKPVSWVAQRLVELWDGDKGWQVEDADHPHEAHYLKLDSAKAAAQLGWQPQWNIDEGLRAVVDWYKCYESGQELRDLMVRQIESYMNTTQGLAGK
ncbi:MAG: CDP-glucose 4,6-dehydratase [Pyrinomonadaceae bacterium]